MNHFIFKGESSADYGVIVENPPEIQIGQLRAETQKIIGSAKLLHYTEGEDAIEPVKFSLECALLRPDDAAINRLCAWLQGGGDLVVPGDEGHYYKAWITSQINLSKVLRLRSDRRFTVQFEREGFRYRYPEAAAFTVQAPGTVNNPGTASAEPLIRLNGSGDVTLMIGDSSLLIDGITDYVMIDCAAQLVYRESVNLGASVTRFGDWPKIPADGCEVGWTGNVTGLEITPRWRDR